MLSKGLIRDRGVKSGGCVVVESWMRVDCNGFRVAMCIEDCCCVMGEDDEDWRSL